MNRLIISLLGAAPLLVLTGCVTERVYYTPGYSPRYAAAKVYYKPGVVDTVVTKKVYSTYPPNYAFVAGYYNTRPYWSMDYYSNSDAYYYGYDDLGDEGYWGMYNSYTVY